MFPKITAVLGAHTELGKRVVRELLRSRYVAKVHALAEVDPRDDISVRPHDHRRLALHLGPLDYVEDTISRHIPECDLAFCVLGCGKKDMAAMGAYQFHKTNLDIPRRFIHEMFTLGVERVALLSHAAASPRARGSEFLRVKGELESIVRELQDEAGEHAPGITVFKVPLILTNLKDASGIRGTSITTSDKIKQKAAGKLELSPSSAVHVRDVAKAMVSDMFHKLHMAETSSEVEPVFRRLDIRYDEMGGQRVVDLANDRRAMQREYNARARQQLTFDHRISGYSRKHSGRGLPSEHSDRHGSERSGGYLGRSFRHGSVRSGSSHEPSFRYASEQSRGSPEHSGTPLEPQKANEDDSNESYMSGSPPDEDVDYDTTIYSGEEAAAYHDGSSALEYGESQGPQSPLPSAEPRRFAHEQGGNDAGSESFHSPERRRRSSAPVTSVEALGHQLGRRLTVIRDNEYLPDADAPTAQPWEDHGAGHPYRQFSNRTVTSPSQSPGRPLYGAPDGTGNGPNSEGRVLDHPVRSHTASLQSPSSGSLSFAVRHDSPVRVPEGQDDRLNSPPRRYSAASYDRSPAYARPYAGHSAERYPDSYASRGLYRDYDYRGGIRSEKGGSRPSSLITRATAFAERVMAATDRPSMKRRRHLSRKQSFRGRDSRDPLGGAGPSLRGNGDIRPAGETTI